MYYNEEKAPLFVTVEEIQYDFSVSKSMAYRIIRELNKELKEKHPNSLIVSGRVNRVWYEEACLLHEKNL